MNVAWYVARTGRMLGSRLADDEGPRRRHSRRPPAPRALAALRDQGRPPFAGCSQHLHLAGRSFRFTEQLLDSRSQISRPGHRSVSPGLNSARRRRLRAPARDHDHQPLPEEQLPYAFLASRPHARLLSTSRSRLVSGSRAEDDSDTDLGTEQLALRAPGADHGRPSAWQPWSGVRWTRESAPPLPRSPHPRRGVAADSRAPRPRRFWLTARTPQLPRLHQLRAATTPSKSISGWPRRRRRGRRRPASSSRSSAFFVRVQPADHRSVALQPAGAQEEIGGVAASTSTTTLEAEQVEEPQPVVSTRGSSEPARRCCEPRPEDDGAALRRGRKRVRMTERGCRSDEASRLARASGRSPSAPGARPHRSRGRA